MVDIARQTVEFLYEENGGIPRDLYLPTIEDIKDEANKFTIDKVRKGFAFPLTSSMKLCVEREVGFSLGLSWPPVHVPNSPACAVRWRTYAEGDMGRGWRVPGRPG